MLRGFARVYVKPVSTKKTQNCINMTLQRELLWVHVSTRILCLQVPGLMFTQDIILQTLCERFKHWQGSASSSLCGKEKLSHKHILCSSSRIYFKTCWIWNRNGFGEAGCKSVFVWFGRIYCELVPLANGLTTALVWLVFSGWCEAFWVMDS